MQKRGIVVEVIDYVEVPNDPIEEQPPAQKHHRSIAVPVLAVALVVVLGVCGILAFARILRNT